MTTADRGKAAETLLKKHLESLCIQADSVFYRLPDARAGSLMATLSDFLFMRKGVLHLLECKAVEHSYRLPYNNTDVAQVAKMRLWKLAGAASIVLVYHAPIKLWRGYDIDRFLDKSEGGSWDLRDTEPKTLKELL